MTPCQSTHSYGPVVPPQGASLASGAGIAAALEPCATCGYGWGNFRHSVPHTGICHAYVPAQPRPDCAKCGHAFHLGRCRTCATSDAMVDCFIYEPMQEEPLTSRPPDGRCEDCGGPAWKPLLCCSACYPKRVARAMLRQRAEQAEQWGHADGCAEETAGKYACDCGLFDYREEARAAAR